MLKRLSSCGLKARCYDIARMALTSIITWVDFSTEKPAVIFEQNQTVSRVPYYVSFEGNQVTILIWVAKRGTPGHWEWTNGSVFHGDVLLWASTPILS